MKRNTFLLVLAMSLVFAGCGPRQQTERDVAEPIAGTLISETHQAFFNNLARLCGQSFAGKEIYRSHHAEGWAEYEMVMHVELCEADRIHIPFRVGDDTSRTWMFLSDNGRLRLRHDHRYPDGTPEEDSLYGGFADDTGTAFVQHFIADEYTAEIIDGGGGNVWTIRLDENFSTFTYRLERDGEKRMRVDFDLTNPL